MGNGGSICLFPKGRDRTSTVGTYQQEERKEEEGAGDGLKFLGGRDKRGKGEWCAFFSLLLSSFFCFRENGEKEEWFCPLFSTVENDCGGHGCGKDKEEEEEEKRALFYFFRECLFS